MLNRTVHRLRCDERLELDADQRCGLCGWDLGFHTLSEFVSPSEQAQIAERLVGHVEALLVRIHMKRWSLFRRAVV